MSWRGAALRDCDGRDHCRELRERGIGTPSALSQWEDLDGRPDLLLCRRSRRLPAQALRRRGAARARGGPPAARSPRRRLKATQASQLPELVGAAPGHGVLHALPKGRRCSIPVLAADAEPTSQPAGRVPETLPLHPAQPSAVDGGSQFVAAPLPSALVNKHIRFRRRDPTSGLSSERLGQTHQPPSLQLKSSASELRATPAGIGTPRIPCRQQNRKVAMRVRKRREERWALHAL